MISVVIPALQEEERVGRAVLSAREADETVVVDGGSTDLTRAVAAAGGARVLVAPRGRGGQLDAGARAVGGDWIVFLHADTRLEAGWAAALAALPHSAAWGAFRFAVDSPRPVYRALETMVALRSRLFRLPYGDQALFVRRTAYAEAGGFPPLPLMEDVALVRRLARRQPPALLPLRAFTSPRRWERHGILATSLRNLLCLVLYAAGHPPDELARRYARHV